MTGKGAWLVASYEIHMHESLSEERPSYGVVSKALDESRVLHARQLCEIFLSIGNYPDNVTLADLVPENDQSALLKELETKLRDKYGSMNTKDSPRWVFHKMLLHPTDERLDGFNYKPALDTVRPLLKLIVAEIESIKGGQFDRRLRA